MESSQHGPQGDKGEEGPSRRRKISPSSIVQLDGAGSLPSDKGLWSCGCYFVLLVGIFC